MADKKIDLEKFLSDPAFQGDRDLMFGVIDARLKHHAEEAEKRRKEKTDSETNIFDRVFGGKKAE